MRVILIMDSIGYVIDEFREEVLIFNLGILFVLFEIFNCFFVKCVRYWIFVYVVVC